MIKLHAIFSILFLSITPINASNDEPAPKAPQAPQNLKLSTTRKRLDSKESMGLYGSAFSTSAACGKRHPNTPKTSEDSDSDLSDPDEKKIVYKPRAIRKTVTNEHNNQGQINPYQTSNEPEETSKEH